MKKVLALVLAALFTCGLVADAEGATSRRKGKKKVKKFRMKSKKVDPRSLLHGPDIWAEAVTRFARDKQGDVVYRENQAIDEENSRYAAVLQTSPAPVWTASHDLSITFADLHRDGEVAVSFGRAFSQAFDILGLPYEEEDEGKPQGEEAETPAAALEVELVIPAEHMLELEGISADILRCSRQFVRVYETLARERRIGDAGALRVDPEARRGEVPQSILNAIDDWLAVVYRLETSAAWFRHGALVRSPVRLDKAWKAVHTAAVDIDALDYWVQKRIAKQEKRRR